ncbi:WxL domain-containing protein [Companilactobacillus sp.]|jgi:hypothetical protein|uniref:WxL domain-containing protein n=1 Tax=Companilactobacillus sp. TaxID=2767905 RepID=UPI0025BC1C06|nr:WxL domain-containing protein [Companilactobacillus sp.]MCH4008970.1 WxL domain-containing protein [Companilactobacillus sp.]MCH4050851.1 WxL domain-containing protein [Companilactobacillus sp.]MCH4076913.1 WxL domain-containing protein [Companilactobacillus sp.]MCH4125488.1 WxL domain-containing protein [Companilactobacillus sp.]MCI1311197.1 WxL domain-containing protein [Companilactobacillus sp.]
MKFSKTALVSSMALCGITLGAVAPTTVSAATSAGSIVNGDYQEGVTYNKNLNNDDWVNATDKQSAYAKSDANVTVVSGFLTLDSVPDFSFGRAIAGKTVDLHQGHSEINDDGNTEGNLQVTESRSDKTETKNNGFTVSAQLAKFTGADTSKSVDGFKLNLNPVDLIDVNSGKSANIKTQQVTLMGEDTNPSTVLNVKSTDNLLGTYKAQFNQSKDASLFVPQKASLDQDKKNTLGIYKGVITWTLATGAGITGNENPVEPDTSSDQQQGQTPNQTTPKA